MPSKSEVISPAEEKSYVKIFCCLLLSRFFILIKNMPKTREQKQEIIKDLKEKLTEQKSVVLVNFEGLDSVKLFKFYYKRFL